MEWYVFVVVVLFLLIVLFNYRRKLDSLETSYQNHFFNNPRPMLIFNPATLQVADVNHAAIDCYGYKREEFLTLNLREIIPEDEAERLEQTIKGATYNTTTTGIGVHKKKNGDILYADIVSRNLSWKGKLMRVAIINNINELVTSKYKLQEAHNRLTETLQRYDTLIEITHEAVWEYNLEKSTLLWNRGIETIFGYTNAPKEAAAWFAKIPGEDIEEVRASVTMAFESKQKTWTKSYRFCCADGSYKHVENRAAIIYNSEGKPVKMIGSMQDAEARYQLEKEVVKLSMIAQVSSNGILVMDKEGYVEWVNESFVNISGFTLEEIKNKRPQEFLHGEETSKTTEQEIREYTQAKRRFSAEVINYRKDGSKYWANVQFSPVVLNGKLQNTIAIQNDITDRKEREQKITEQNLRLKEIAFANSHIIRAPVANIMGLCNLLSMSSTLHEEEKELVGYLLETTDKLDALIRNIAQRSETI